MTDQIALIESHQDGRVVVYYRDGAMITLRHGLTKDRTMLQVDKETWVAREHIKAATYQIERSDEDGVKVGDVTITFGEKNVYGNDNERYWLHVDREHCEEMARALGIGPYGHTQLVTQNPSQSGDRVGI